MDKISVIMPTYNRGYTIGRAIESVLNQTYKDFELIIIDDGSTDDTKEIVEEYKDFRLRYEWFEHKGKSSALNRGLKKAKGELVAYLDSDDIWDRHFLETMAQKLNEKTDVGMVYCGVTIICQGENGETIGEYIQKEPFNYDKLLRKNFISGCTVLHKKECIDKIGGFDERLDCLVDWDIFIRIGKEYKIDFVDQVLATAYYGRDDNITTTVDPLRSHLLIMSKIRSMGKPLYTLIIEKNNNGEYHGYLPALKGCFVKGRSRNEVLGRIQEVVKDHIGSHKSLPKEIELVILNRGIEKAG